MIKFSEHLYYYEDTCNVYVIKNGKHGLLIDFGSGRILDELSQAGITIIDGILITHHHRDQTQGLKTANEQGIPIYVPHGEQDLIARAGQMWSYRPILNNYNNRQDRFSVLDSISIAGTLKDYNDFLWKNLTLTIHPTPGHTTGSISISCHLDGVFLAFTGDLVYSPGKVWSLAATQWSYNGGEGIPFTILSLLDLKEKGIETFLPSHGAPHKTTYIHKTVDGLWSLCQFRRHNPRLLQLREKPYEVITPHVLFNRTSMSNAYVLLSDSGKAAIFDLGYDFMAGTASGDDRSSRRPWLYTIPHLFSEFHVTSIDICLCTHYHDDHVAGMNLLHDVYGTKRLCAESFADILEHPYHYDLPCLWYDPINVDQKLPLNTKIQWEEYEFTLHPLSGHTKHSVVIEFDADGKKVLCTGDQYADEDGLCCNYVYKNIFDPTDFIASAKLYKKLRPDLLLTGHWPRFTQDDRYIETLLVRGEALATLHSSLLPYESYHAPSSDFCAVMYPYQAFASPGENIKIRVDITNPLLTEQLMSAKLAIPDGCSCTYPIQEALVKGQETFSLFFEVTAPQHAVYRLLVGCDIIAGTNNLGQQAEMMIHVTG